jgi:hypothetical protein
VHDNRGLSLQALHRSDSHTFRPSQNRQYFRNQKSIQSNWIVLKVLACFTTASSAESSNMPAILPTKQRLWQNSARMRRLQNKLGID